MTRANGVHHLAISTGDIKSQIEFFSDVLGCELVALYWMHGVKGFWHGFLRLNDSSSIAFVQGPETPTIPPVEGVSHAGNAGGYTSPGSMQHVSFNVDTYDDLLAMRDRIRSRGVNVMGPLHHGMCDSIYFAGPEGLVLEVATSAAPIDGDHWIDPEVVALAGITPEELDRFRSPAVYRQPASPLPNPPIDPTKPHLKYPKEVYEALMSMPDEVLTERMSESVPPVP